LVESDRTHRDRWAVSGAVTPRDPSAESAADPTHQDLSEVWAVAPIPRDLWAVSVVGPIHPVL